MSENLKPPQVVPESTPAIMRDVAKIKQDLLALHNLGLSLNVIGQAELMLGALQHTVRYERAEADACLAEFKEMKNDPDFISNLEKAKTDRVNFLRSAQRYEAWKKRVIECLQAEVLHSN